MRNCASPPDPFFLIDAQSGLATFRQPAGLSVRSPVINPALKTLVLITTGQSMLATVSPSAFAPTNSSVVDQFNVFDGQIYSITGPVFGTTLFGSNLGNVSVRLADKFIPIFDRVIIVGLNIGSTSSAMWATGGIHSNRGPVAMRRLAARGITPATPGVTFGCLMAIGEQDLIDGTSQAAMTANLISFMNIMTNAGFSGRFFITQESAKGQTSNAIRSAQASLWNGTTVFNGGDFDSASIATYDGSHPTDAGAATMATLAYNAIHSSGSPY